MDPNENTNQENRKLNSKMKEDDSNAYYEIYSSQLNGRDFIVKGSTPCLYDLLFKVTQQGTYDVSFSHILEPKVNNKI
jgi:hypothetical protein